MCDSCGPFYERETKRIFEELRAKGWRPFEIARLGELLTKAASPSEEELGALVAASDGALWASGPDGEPRKLG